MYVDRNSVLTQGTGIAILCWLDVRGALFFGNKPKGNLILRGLSLDFQTFIQECLAYLKMTLENESTRNGTALTPSQRSITFSWCWVNTEWHTVHLMLSQRGMIYTLGWAKEELCSLDAESMRNDIQLMLSHRRIMFPWCWVNAEWYIYIHHTLSQRRIMFPPDTMRMHLFLW